MSEIYFHFYRPPAGGVSLDGMRENRSLSLLFGGGFKRKFWYFFAPLWGTYPWMGFSRKNFLLPLFRARLPGWDLFPPFAVSLVCEIHGLTSKNVPPRVGHTPGWGRFPHFVVSLV